MAAIFCKRLQLLRMKMPGVIHPTGLTAVYGCIIHKENPTRSNSVSKFFISYLYEAHHVLGDTPPIIRSIKLHWQPLVLNMWKVVGCVVAGRCRRTASSSYTFNNSPRMQNQRLLVQFYAPDDGRCVAQNMVSFI